MFLYLDYDQQTSICSLMELLQVKLNTRIGFHLPSQLDSLSESRS